MKRPASVLMVDVGGLEPAGEQALTARVEGRIRRAILDGSLAAGSRLPSSRVLARDLKVSRHTVEWAFVQLQAEGFLVRRRGSGTFVAEGIPDRERPPESARRSRRLAVTPPALSRRGAGIVSIAGHHTPAEGIAFTPDAPAVELFPRQIWDRLVSRAIRRAGTEHLAYGSSNGLPALREAIAAHAAATRAVACTPEQVIVLTSAHQAVDLVTRVLLDEGDVAWVEDPGYPSAVQLLRAAGARVSPVPVDTDGFDVDAALAIQPAARIAYVTPSHQYPSGGLMALRRRLALLAWAERESGWILEDDYDGDFRYVGRPLAALQALDPAGRVLYVGTFNKMTFPALRLAFLVAPPSLVDAFLAAKHMMDGCTPTHTQAALADFIQEGHLATHLRRMLGEYDRRRGALLTALDTLADELEVGPADAGLHLTAYLRRPLDDRRIAAVCAKAGVALRPLSPYYLGPARPGFVLGFACSRPARTTAAMRIVARAIKGPKLDR